MLWDKPIVERVYSIAALALMLSFLLIIVSVVRSSLFGTVEPEKHVYFEIVFMLFLAIIAEIMVFYLKQQSVIILMLIGMLMSTSFIESAWSFLISVGVPVPPTPPDIIRNKEIIALFSHLGAIILLFKVGLHSKIEKIFSKENLVVATIGVIIPFVAGFSYAWFTGGNFAFSMFLGAALTATSVGVTVAILRELNVLDKRYSNVIIGAAVIDDVLSLLVLSVVLGVTGSEQISASSIFFTLFTSIAFLAGAILFGNQFVHYFDSQVMDSRKLLLALALMFFLSYVAELIHLSAIVGAFIAGIVLSKSKHYKLLEEETFVLELIFMPIFFISLGMLVDLVSLSTFVVPIIIITVLSVLTKIIGCGGASLFMGMSSSESAIIGMGMVPRGEVALIIASIGLSSAVLTNSEYSIIAAMALLTSFIVPPILEKLIKRQKEQNGNAVAPQQPAVTEQ